MVEEKVVAKGLEGVVVGDTALSKVDGEHGRLLYRGYNIDDIAHLTYEEICFLFLHGELPDENQKKTMKEDLANRYNIKDDVINFICKSAQNDHPMATLRTAVSMLSAGTKEADPDDRQQQINCAKDLIAKTATITAAIARVREKKDPVVPNISYGFSKNFLYMFTGETPQDVICQTMDTALVLHMDHSFNASTFTARVVASTLSDLVSAVTAALGSLKGSLHGGANTAVMKMLKEIGEVDNVEPWLDKALEQKRKIMGFGHRVYKVKDPRAKHLQRMSKEWGERSHESKWFKMSEKLEDLMLDKKGINANVDFYSASTYYAMGINPDMYTPIFAVARMVGWTAHVMEQFSDNRIMRPAANYVGPKEQRL